MAVTVLETMSRGELSTYREYAGMVEGIRNGDVHKEMSAQEIRDFFIRYWEFTADIMERYGIEDEEAIETKFCVFTGQIYVGIEDWHEVPDHQRSGAVTREYHHRRGAGSGAEGQGEAEGAGAPRDIQKVGG